MITPLYNPIRRFAPEVLKRLHDSEHWLQRYSPIGLLVVLLSFSLWAWLASRGVRFEFDELLELCAATAPTIGGVISFLGSGVDYNPPLSHLFIRESLALFGNTELAARLPAFLGMIALLICLYFYVSRMLTSSYGLLAVTLMVCSPIRIYAHQARPYGIVLGFTALALVCYQQAVTGRKRYLALPGLAVCTACLAASHYYAVLALSAFLFAEAVRAVAARRLDWSILAWSCIPPIAVLFLLRDIIRQQKQQLAHYFATGNLLSFNHGYEILDIDPLIYCLALVLIVTVVGLVFRFGKQPAPFPSGPEPYETALGAGLLLLPVIGAVCTQFVTHAYVPRYFLPAALGFCICVAIAVRLFSCVVPGLLLLLLVSLGLGFGKEVLRVASHGAAPLPPGSELMAAEGPILFDTPFEYMQVNYYFPQLRDKTWVITDPSASLKYRKYDTDDNIMLAIAAKGRAQSISLAAAARRWPRFNLIPRAQDSVWALQCVLASGARVQVRHPFGTSNFLFDVSLTPESLPNIESCSAAPTR